MTAAQKIAKEKFKKAIAYRKISGCTLKEAFAKIYNKKTAPIKKATSNVKRLVDKAKKAFKEGYDERAKEIALKKAAQKVGAVKKKKAAPKKAAKKVVQKTKPRYSATKHTNWETIPAHKRRVNGLPKKKKVSEKSILNKIHKVKDEVNSLDQLQHKHMSKVGSVTKHFLDELNNSTKKFYDYKFFIITLNKELKYNKNLSIAQKKELRENIKTYSILMKEEKIHNTQLRKLIK
jgi:glutaredoxin-related protein